MKHQNLKIGIFAAVFALLPALMIAQTSTPTLENTPNPVPPGTYTEFTPSGYESIDSVTVGSRMPYQVEAQTPVTGLTFEYKWLFAPGQPILDIDGATLTPTTGDYYNTNEISVEIPDAPNTIMTITANVRSMLGGVQLCTGSDSTYSIRILPRPTVDWASSTPLADCAAVPVSIPLTLTGNKDFEVEYIINYYSTYVNGGTPTSTSAVKYIVLTDDNLILPATEFASGNGLYEIEITGITDRISRKSLDPIASDTDDLPNDAFQVLIYPAPVTNPVQHVRNLP